ncbi:TRAP transporter large permease subunit [Fusobacterium animalis]|uniref:TRAP transporter large permease n=1 Tax=Fusobacterium animalis TaxID=76859 RepID=UPI0021625A55|nr:TRAP transporter large permease subunit [Fusobacterium animalis]
MRYIFNNSLSWSEELGKFLFVWISWLGISIGAKRKEHIKITMFIDKVSPKLKCLCDILSELIIFGICAVTAYYGLELVISQSQIFFAGIKISMSWGYLSVVLGCFIMMIRNLIIIKDTFTTLKKGGKRMTFLVLFIVLFIMLAIGVPVGFAIGGATMISMYFCSNLNMVVNAQYCFSGINSFTVMAIPFFMLAGLIMSTGGIAKRIVNFASALIDFVIGALGCVTILACMFFGALSGSGMATTSAIGGMMIPEMKKKGYSSEYAATLVCFGGIVGPIIPPSLSFVLYGATTNTPVPELFLAGVLPGVFLGLIFLLMNILICKKTKTEVRKIEEKTVTLKELLLNRLKRIWIATKEGIWALLSPTIILGGIYSGIFTPTEAACISVVYSAFVSYFIYKDLNLKALYNTLLDAAVLNGITSFLLGYSTVFSTFMTFEKVPQLISTFLTTISSNPFVVLFFINLILLFIGLFLDTVPAIIVMAPMLLPTVKALGINPVHFGVVMAVNLAIGLCTPPYGCNLFVGAAVAKIKLDSMFKLIIPFFLAAIFALAIITYVPWLSLVFIK